MPSDVTGLILAGGRSRRFGTDKALACVEGGPFVARVYAALAPHCAGVVVSVRAGATYPLPGPARFVADRVPDAGPLAGLDAGLAATATPWLLAVACDLPFVTAEVLDTLLAARSDEVEAVVAIADGRRQPLCACYTRRVHPIFEACLASEDRSMYGLLARLRVREVAVPAEALRNVNTPRDLDRP